MWKRGGGSRVPTSIGSPPFLPPLFLLLGGCGCGLTACLRLLSNPRLVGRGRRLAARRPAATGTTAERCPHLHGKAVVEAPHPAPVAAHPRPAFRARLPRCLCWRLRREPWYFTSSLLFTRCSATGVRRNAPVRSIVAARKLLRTLLKFVQALFLLVGP